MGKCGLQMLVEEPYGPRSQAGWLIQLRSGDRSETEMKTKVIPVQKKQSNKCVRVTPMQPVKLTLTYVNLHSKQMETLVKCRILLDLFLYFVCVIIQEGF